MNTSAYTHTVVGVFDDRSAAARAVEGLTASGFNHDEIQVADESAQSHHAAAGRPASEHSAGNGIAGFFRRMFGEDTDEKDTGAYAEAVRRGAIVVSVSVDEQDQQRAAEIMNTAGAVDIDQNGMAGSRGEYLGGQALPGRKSSGSESGQRSIPVVEEELRVGKRAMQHGAVRVYNRVREEPVEQQVNLREEHVNVERRKVDRPATEEDLRKRDEVIEFTEMTEEPVVEKRTRVIEEVLVGKETSNRTETVRDTVRRSDVNVERSGSPATVTSDDDFRADFKTRFGSVPTARYEDYAPAYQYGYAAASDARYRGSWDEVQPQLRADFERNNPRSKWEEMKDAVRHGWEKVTVRP